MTAAHCVDKWEKQRPAFLSPWEEKSLALLQEYVFLTTQGKTLKWVFEDL